jgi:hypothetical protein
MPVFDGFALDFMNVGEATLRVRHGGSGPPVLRLHGHPRTHATWHLWTAWAGDLRGAPIASGHHMAEEAPDALAAELLAFLNESG